MLDERTAHRAAAEDQVEDAFRETGFMNDLGERVRRGGRQRRGLDDHGVAKRQSRRAFPCRNCNGEIPRRYQSEHTERLAIGFHRDARDASNRRLRRDVAAPRQQNT
jgi:hypothetical protein